MLASSIYKRSRLAEENRGPVMTTVQLSSLSDTRKRQRTTLTFSVEGLAAREELLFKGYVRLLDHLTEHNWRYCEPSMAQRIDLLVADERVQPTRCLQATSRPQPVLQLGTSKSASHAFFLSWPLKPYELENELNRLGRLLEGYSASVQVPSPQQFSFEPVQTAPAQKLYRLRQWPKPSLLTEPGSMRLATLMTGRAMGLEELMYRSALSQAVCTRFVATMQAANMMVEPSVATSPSPPWTPPTFATPASLAQHERQAGPPAVKAVAPPGLLARIRMRLGIKA